MTASDAPEQNRSASQPRVVYTATSGVPTRLSEAVGDLAAAVFRPRLWIALSVQDVKARYRGSLLGPWWITISMAALISGMSVLYSNLMHLSLEEYVPWMCCGIVLWGFLAATIQEGCEALTGAAMVLRQTALPTCMFMLRTVLRNMIVLAHNLVIVGAMVLLFNLTDGLRPFEFAAALLATTFVLICVVTIASIASARFRDIPQIIAAVLQVLLFLTPVFWRADQLPQKAEFLLANPAFHLIQIMRSPLIGSETPWGSWIFVGILSAALAVAAFFTYASARRRIVHFL
jgi:ABC-type polysaccharide/polyol phosphate export permease